MSKELNELLKNRLLNVDYKISKKLLEESLVGEEVDRDAVVKQILVQELISKQSTFFKDRIEVREDGDELRYTSKFAIFGWKEVYQLMLSIIELNDEEKFNLKNSIKKLM